MGQPARVGSHCYRRGEEVYYVDRELKKEEEAVRVERIGVRENYVSVGCPVSMGR